MVTLSGYGLLLTVESGHLILRDGLADQRREARISRADATRASLARVTVIGHSGSISLDALHWLHGVGASLTVSEADGNLLLTAAPPDPGDAAMRRAQALAAGTWEGAIITRTLLDRKLAGQALTLDSLDGIIPGSTAAAALIRDHCQLLSAALDPDRGGCRPLVSATLAGLRLIEARAAEVYWSALSLAPVAFVRRTADRIPDPWCSFGQRHSPLSGSPRHALTPGHAVLNYLYAVAESEVRVALMSAGLDPALGILHTDAGSRASMALDILDAIRPAVDRYALTLLRDRPLSRHDVGELPSGICRLRPALASLLCETAPRWRLLAVEAVEMVAGMLRAMAADIFTSPASGAGWEGIPGATSTGRVERSPRAHGARVTAVPGSPGRVLRGRPSTAPVRGPGRCQDCGAAATGDRLRCARCAALWRVEEGERVTTGGPARLAQLRAAGQDPAHGPEPEAERRATQRAHRAADAEWQRRHGSTGDPARWARLRPRLADVPLSQLREATGYSLRHCSHIRAGLVIPHPRVWAALDRLSRATPAA
jgi:CRISPR-associated protein Cas1